MTDQDVVGDIKDDRGGSDQTPFDDPPLTEIGLKLTLFSAQGYGPTIR